MTAPGETISDIPRFEGTFASLYDFATQNQLQEPHWFVAAPSGVSGDVRIWRLDEIRNGDELVDMNAPGATKLGGTYRFTSYQLGMPDVAESHTSVILAANKKRYKFAPPIRKATELNVPSLCAHFAEQAQTSQQLGTVTDGLVRWASEVYTLESSKLTAESPWTVAAALQRNFTFAMDHIIAKGIQLETFDAPGNPVLYSLGQLNQEGVPQRARQVLKHAIGITFGEIFSHKSGSANQRNAPAVIVGLDKVAAVRAATAMEEAGMMGDNFWAQYALAATHTSPQILGLVRDRLKSSNNAIFIKELTGTTRNIVTNRIQNLLELYSQDETRHQKHTRALLDKSASQDGKNHFSLYAFIALTNLISAHLNSTGTTAGHESALLLPLDPNKAEDAGEALARVIHLTRNPDADPQLIAAQRKQDMLHAEIVGLLAKQANPNKLRYKPTKNLQALGELLLDPKI